jgi:hypothetical protein
MGHNLCLDIFGGPSAEEAGAGFPAHGEVTTARFEIETSRESLTMRARLPEAQLRFERRIDLAGRAVRMRERVENLSASDRPVGWTQHVTLGPPFLEKGRTELRASARRSKVFEGTFGPADYLASGAEFDWPRAPRVGGGTTDLRVYTDADASSAYTANQMDPALEHAYFVAFPRRRGSHSGVCGAARTSRGWASGKRTVPGPGRLGTTAGRPGRLSSASRHFPSRAGR